jgi:hypothetical protein
MKGVVVDYRSGRLVFDWQHGGESDVVYGWPEEEVPDTSNDALQKS